MVKKVSLQLSDKAFAKLTQLSKRLGLSADEFATICLEYVDIKHQGIKTAANTLKQKKTSAINKQNLEQHLKQLSAEQIALLLSKAAKKSKN